MLTEERQNLILKYLEAEKAVTVAEFAELLHASESTVRRDLNSLHRQGKLLKVHGGATLKERPVAVEHDMKTKSTLHLPEKQKIGRYAASLVQKDDFVYLDAGSTTEFMAQYVEQPAEFVTNGVSHARKLAMRGFKVHLLGGEYKLSTEAIIGAEAMRALSDYHFTKAFLGTNGISPSGGYTTPDAREACVKREAIKRAYQAYVLADHSKFNMDSCITFAGLSDARIITDVQPGKNYEDYTVVKEV